LSITTAYSGHGIPLTDECKVFKAELFSFSLSSLEKVLEIQTDEAVYEPWRGEIIFTVYVFLGVSAEEVASNAVEELKDSLENNCCVDQHLQDQVRVFPTNPDSQLFEVQLTRSLLLNTGLRYQSFCDHSRNCMRIGKL
jgi:hypothetical protein